MKKTSIEFDFSSLAIKGRGSQGNIISRNPIKSIAKRDEGVSTLGARNIWYDDTVNRLNADERGKHLGAFLGEDKILTINASGHYKLYNYDLSTHFDEDMIFIEKFKPNEILTVIYREGESGLLYLKRFQLEVTDRKSGFMNDHPQSSMQVYTFDRYPIVELYFAKRKDGKPRENEIVNLHDFIGLKGYKAKGKRLSDKEIVKLEMLEPLPYEEPVEEETGSDLEEQNGDSSDVNERTEKEVADNLSVKTEDAKEDSIADEASHVAAEPDKPKNLPKDKTKPTKKTRAPKKKSKKDSDTIVDEESGQILLDL